MALATADACHAELYYVCEPSAGWRGNRALPAPQASPEGADGARHDAHLQTMQYAFIPFYPIIRLLGQGNSMREIALSQLVLARDGYDKFAISPKDIVKLAKNF